MVRVEFAAGEATLTGAEWFSENADLADFLNQMFELGDPPGDHPDHELWHAEYALEYLPGIILEHQSRVTNHRPWNADE